MRLKISFRIDNFQLEDTSIDNENDLKIIITLGKYPPLEIEHPFTNQIAKAANLREELFPRLQKSCDISCELCQQTDSLNTITVAGAPLWQNLDSPQEFPLSFQNDSGDALATATLVGEIDLITSDTDSVHSVYTYRSLASQAREEGEADLPRERASSRAQTTPSRLRQTRPRTPAQMARESTRRLYDEDPAHLRRMEQLEDMEEQAMLAERAQQRREKMWRDGQMNSTASPVTNKKALTATTRLYDNDYTRKRKAEELEEMNKMMDASLKEQQHREKMWREGRMTGESARENMNEKAKETTKRLYDDDLRVVKEKKEREEIEEEVRLNAEASQRREQQWLERAQTKQPPPPCGKKAQEVTERLYDKDYTHMAVMQDLDTGKKNFEKEQKKKQFREELWLTIAHSKDGMSAERKHELLVSMHPKGAATWPDTIQRLYENRG